ncbi:MAG: transglutaminase [Chitinophagales bacterium]|nr:MAG: transglutaminase [Chitinophagales bacterium]
MEITVDHSLRYSYSAPVYLEPQILYLTPRPSLHTQILEHHLEIVPAPALLAQNLDSEGNLQHVAHFQELTDRLEVKVTMRIRNSLENPFAFYVYPFELANFPMEYPKRLRRVLRPYLKVRSDRLVDDYMKGLRNQKGDPVIDFLGALAKKISGDFGYEFREKGRPHSPDYFLRKGKGSCRDYAGLCAEVCRRSGIAARFVSGYFRGDAELSHHLHGWIEVYLPGAGWRGLDPTQGVWADDKYIALAASLYPDKIAPVNGSYRGGAEARMKVEVVIR